MDSFFFLVFFCFVLSNEALTFIRGCYNHVLCCGHMCATCVCANRKPRPTGLQLAALQLCAAPAHGAGSHSHGNIIKSSAAMWQLSDVFHWNCDLASPIWIKMLIPCINRGTCGAEGENMVCREEQRATEEIGLAALGVRKAYVLGI